MYMIDSQMPSDDERFRDMTRQVISPTFRSFVGGNCAEDFL